MFEEGGIILIVLTGGIHVVCLGAPIVLNLDQATKIERTHFACWRPKVPVWLSFVASQHCLELFFFLWQTGIKISWDLDALYKHNMPHFTTATSGHKQHIERKASTAIKVSHNSLHSFYGVLWILVGDNGLAIYKQLMLSTTTMPGKGHYDAERVTRYSTEQQHQSL